jgi:hypothetical protein
MEDAETTIKFGGLTPFYDALAFAGGLTKTMLQVFATSSTPQRLLRENLKSV